MIAKITSPSTVIYVCKLISYLLLSNLHGATLMEKVIQVTLFLKVYRFGEEEIFFSIKK